MFSSTVPPNGSDSTGLLFPTVLDPPRKAMRMVPRRIPLLTSTKKDDDGATTNPPSSTGGVSSSINKQNNSLITTIPPSSSAADIPNTTTNAPRPVAIGQPVPKSKNLMNNNTSSHHPPNFSSHHHHPSSGGHSSTSSSSSGIHHPYNTNIPEELKMAVTSFNDTVTKEHDLPRAISVLRNALSSSMHGITPTASLANVSTIVDNTIIPTLRQVLQQYIDEQSGDRSSSPSSTVRTTGSSSSNTSIPPPLLLPSPVSTDIAFDCLLSLVNIGAGDNAIIRLLLKHNIHTLCVNLLHIALKNSTNSSIDTGLSLPTSSSSSSSSSTSSTELVETAIWLLGNIAGDGSGSREEIYKINAIDIIIQWIAKELTYLGYFPFGLPSTTVPLAVDSTSTPISGGESSTGPSSVPNEIEYTSSLLKIATWTISNLCEGDNNNDGFVISDIGNLLAVLNVCLDCPDFEVLSHACWSLSHLADGPPEHLHDVLCTLATTTSFPNVDDKLNPVGRWIIQECVPTEDMEISNTPLPQPNPSSLLSIRNTLVRYSNSSLKKKKKKLDNSLLITDTAKDAGNSTTQASVYRYSLPCTAAKLVRLLRHDVPRVVKPALRCVGNIVCAESGVSDDDDDDIDEEDNDVYPVDNNTNFRNAHRNNSNNNESKLHTNTNENDYTELMCSLGIVPQLRRLMEGSSREMLKEACWSMSNVAAGTTNQIQAVLDSGCLPRVVQLCQDPSTDAGVRAEAGWIVLNSTSCGTDQQVEQLVKAGVVHVLCHMLSDPGMGVMALEGLEKIVSAYEKLVHGTTPSSAIANVSSPSSSSPIATLTNVNESDSKEKDVGTKKGPAVPPVASTKTTAKPLSFFPPGPIETGTITSSTKGQKNNGTNTAKHGTNASSNISGYPLHPSMVGNNGPITLVSALATAITSAFDIITSGNKTSSPTGNNTVRVLDDAVLSDAKYLLETFRTELLSQSNNGMVSNYFGGKDGNNKDSSMNNSAISNANPLSSNGNSKSSTTPTGESALRRVSKLWTDHFVTCGLCRRTWARTSNETRYCEECRCDVCNECNCTIYHLSYQLELLGSDEEKTTKDKGKNKKDKNKDKNKEKNNNNNKTASTNVPASSAANPSNGNSGGNSTVPTTTAASSNDKKEKGNTNGNSKPSTNTSKETSIPTVSTTTIDSYENDSEDTMLSQLKNAPKTVRRAMQATFGPTSTSTSTITIPTSPVTSTTTTTATEVTSPNSSEWHAVTKPNPNTKSKRRDLGGTSELSIPSSVSSAVASKTTTSGSGNNNLSTYSNALGNKATNTSANVINNANTPSKSSANGNSVPSTGKATVTAPSVPVTSSSSSISVNPQSPWGKSKTVIANSTATTTTNNAQFPSLSSTSTVSTAISNTSGSKLSSVSTSGTNHATASSLASIMTNNTPFVPDANSISLAIPLTDVPTKDAHHHHDLPPKGTNRTWKTVVSGKQSTTVNPIDNNDNTSTNTTIDTHHPDRKVSYSSVISGKSGGSNSTGPSSPSFKAMNHNGIGNDIPSLDSMVSSGNNGSSNLGPAWKGRIPVTVKPVVPEKSSKISNDGTMDNHDNEFVSTYTDSTENFGSNAYFPLDNTDLAQAQQLFLGTMSSFLQNAVQNQHGTNPSHGSLPYPTNPNTLFNPSDMNSSLRPGMVHPNGGVPGYTFSTSNPPFPPNPPQNSGLPLNVLNNYLQTNNATLRSNVPINAPMNSSMNSNYSHSALPPLPPSSINSIGNPLLGTNNNSNGYSKGMNLNPPLPASTVPNSFLIPASTNYIPSVSTHNNVSRNDNTLPLGPGSVTNPSTANISFVAGVHVPTPSSSNSTNPSNLSMENGNNNLPPPLPFGMGNNTNNHNNNNNNGPPVNPLGLTQEAFMALFTQAMNDAGITIGGGGANTDLHSNSTNDYGMDPTNNANGYGNNNNYSMMNGINPNDTRYNNSQRKLRSRGESMHDNNSLVPGNSSSSNGNYPLSPQGNSSNSNRPRSSSTRWQSNSSGNSGPPPLTLDSFIRTEASRKLSSHNNSTRDENDEDDENNTLHNDSSIHSDGMNDQITSPSSTGQGYNLHHNHGNNPQDLPPFNYNSVVSSMGVTSTSTSLGNISKNSSVSSAYDTQRSSVAMNNSVLGYNTLFSNDNNSSSSSILPSNTLFHGINSNNNIPNDISNTGINLDVVFGTNSPFSGTGGGININNNNNIPIIHNTSSTASFLQSFTASGIFNSSSSSSSNSTASLLPNPNSFMNSFESVFGPTGSAVTVSSSSSSSSLSTDPLLPTSSTINNAFASPFSLGSFHQNTPTASAANTNNNGSSMWSIHPPPPKSPSLLSSSVGNPVSSMGGSGPSSSSSLEMLRTNFGLNGPPNINNIKNGLLSSVTLSPDRTLTNDSIGFDLNTLGLMDDLPDTPNNPNNPKSSSTIGMMVSSHHTPPISLLHGTGNTSNNNNNSHRPQHPLFSSPHAVSTQQQQQQLLQQDTEDMLKSVMNFTNSMME